MEFNSQAIFVVHFVREEQLDTSVVGVNLTVVAKVEELPV